MAKVKKKKKIGLVQRMMFGDTSKPDLTPEQTRMKKWDLFKYLFFSNLGTMVILNLLTFLFALPAGATLLLFSLNKSVAAGYLPYSANFGIGYPVIVDAGASGTLVEFSYNLYEFLIMIPCIAVFAVGLAGNFYVMRKLIWQQPVRRFKDFFVGIKECWGHALIIGTIFGLAVLLLVFSAGYFDVYGQPAALKALSLTLSIILFIFISLFTAFYMTQCAAFDLKVGVLIRNSLLFVLATNVQAIFFVGIAVAPAFLMFVPGITMLLVLLYVFLGFSFATLVISLFCHHCFEKFLYDKIENKPETVYARKTAFPDQPEKKKKQQAQPYKNPKKRKRSIDEGSSITPLAPTFRREDLERLEREHEEVMRESEVAEAGSDGDTAAEDDN